MLTLGCAALSLVRKESGRPFAVIVLICGVGLWLLAQSGVGGDTMEDISRKVANDAIDQYYIAERQGDKMQICVQADFVTAALLQQKDEARYKIRKQTEDSV